MYHKYWAITETRVGSPAAAQNQGYLVNRHGVWEQVLGELQAVAHLPANHLVPAGCWQSHCPVLSVSQRGRQLVR